MRTLRFPWCLFKPVREISAGEGKRCFNGNDAGRNTKEACAAWHHASTSARQHVGKKGRYFMVCPGSPTRSRQVAVVVGRFQSPRRRGASPVCTRPDRAINVRVARRPRWRCGSWRRGPRRRDRPNDAGDVVGDVVAGVWRLVEDGAVVLWVGRIEGRTAPVVFRLVRVHFVHRGRWGRCKAWCCRAKGPAPAVVVIVRVTLRAAFPCSTRRGSRSRSAGMWVSRDADESGAHGNCARRCYTCTPLLFLIPTHSHLHQ